jgi:hypothetical protein
MFAPESTGLTWTDVQPVIANATKIAVAVFIETPLWLLMPHAVNLLSISST